MSENKTTTIEKVRKDLLGPAMLAEIQKALPKALKMNAERLCRIALTNLQRTPGLAECDPKSLLGTVMSAAQLGLDLDPVLGQAYMVPYNTKNGKLCQLQVGYRGFEQLAVRSGKVSYIAAECVYENDLFDYELGSGAWLKHKPAKGERGNLIGAYAMANLKDGGKPFKFMSLSEIESIRLRSKAKDAGPWKTDYAEMARKCPIRKLAKDLPISAEFVKAAVLDEYAETGVYLEQDGMMEGPKKIEGTKADRLNKALEGKKEQEHADPTATEAPAEPLEMEGE